MKAALELAARSRRTAWTLAALAVLLAMPSAAAHALAGPGLPTSHATPLQAAVEALRPHGPEIGGPGTTLPGIGWTALKEAPGDPPGIQFVCPGVDGGTSVNDGYNTLTMRATCPYRVVDDADLLGSTQIAVRWDDPREVAFFSLHGAGTTEGPTSRSRDPDPPATDTVTGLSHTIFSSTDQGRSWSDNPWGQEGFGEHVSGVMDLRGNLYAAALWASPGRAPGTFDYHFKLYKGDTVQTDVGRTYYNHRLVEARAPGNEIPEVNLAFVPPRIVLADGNATNGTGPVAPAEPGQVGNYTTPQNETALGGGWVMAVWHERAADLGNATAAGKSSWIDAAWSDTGPRNNWTRLADDELIGPCMAASNPVAYDGKVYVACVADAGYTARSRARIGDVDVWSIDPATGKTRLVDATPLSGGRPRLAARPDGYMALASVDVENEDRVRAEVAFGWYGKYWSPAGDAGPALYALAGGHPVRDGRITALGLLQDSNTLLLVYMERVNTTLRAPEPNPSTLDPDPTSQIEYKKLVTTFNQCDGGPIAAYDLNLGVARHPFADGVVNDATGAFDDLQDGMQVVRDDAGNELAYFAYGDHGVVQYGAIVSSSVAGFCPVFQPPPIVPVPPVPAALTVSSPAATIVGSAVGVTTIAMVSYLLTVRRRAAVFAAAKAK